MPFDKYPSVDFVRQCVREQDGRLYWLVRPKEHFANDHAWNMWNTRFSLKEAGGLFSTHKQEQRWKLSFNGQGILRYVIVWALHHGKWEIGLDHKDRNPLNDCIDNLRPASPSQNRANTTIHANNRSGAKGVFWDKRRNRWRVQINHSKKPIWVGYFDDLEEAKAARAAAAQKYHGEFACDGTPVQTAKVNT